MKNKKLLFFLSPIVLLTEILLINLIFQLLREPSDTAVFVGVTLICPFAFLNYLLINFIIKQFKTK